MTREKKYKEALSKIKAILDTVEEQTNPNISIILAYEQDSALIEICDIVIEALE